MKMWRWIKRIVLGIVALLLIAVGLLYRGDIAPETLRQKYATTESEFIRVEPGLAVHVRDQGPAAAPVIVLLHGSNSSLQTWEPWVAKLTGTYRVITMDLPGHGLTGPHPRDAYQAADVVAVVDAVMRAKNIDAFVMGGNSMGGWVTWEYALAHPDKVTAMILVDAAGAPSKLDAKRELPLGFRLATTPVVRDIGQKLTPRIMIEKSVHQSVSVQSSITPEVVDRYWELLRYPGNRRATILRFAVKRDNDISALHALHIPALILWGREDKLIPVVSANAFADALLHDDTIIYDGVGHLPMEEIADRSVDDVRRWLAGLNTANPQSVSPAGKK
jgi:pimeloyl-ACP methyl ester carboxylesterase